MNRTVWNGGIRDDKNIKIIFFICIPRYALFIYLLIYFLHAWMNTTTDDERKIKHKYKERLVASIKLDVITSFNVIFWDIRSQKSSLYVCVSGRDNAVIFIHDTFYWSFNLTCVALKVIFLNEAFTKFITIVLKIDMSYPHRTFWRPTDCLRQWDFGFRFAKYFTWKVSYLKLICRRLLRHHTYIDVTWLTKFFHFSFRSFFFLISIWFTIVNNFRLMWSAAFRLMKSCDLLSFDVSRMVLDVEMRLWIKENFMDFKIMRLCIEI
jgi:hypothetical protein